MLLRQGLECQSALIRRIFFTVRGMSKIVLKRKAPLVSVCIPVYMSEEYLSSCLESIVKQNFSFFEIIIVDDFSSGKDLNGRDCKKIVKDFIKKNKAVLKEKKIDLSLIFHENNKGLFESRRTALYESRGDYIYFADSDDLLLPNCLKSLYEAAEKSGAQIVQAEADVAFRQKNENGSDGDKKKKESYFLSRQKSVNLIHHGSLEGEKILSCYLEKKEISSFLWTKLFSRELLLDALDGIPPLYCTLGEDFLIFVLAASKASKYEGIKDLVYTYFIDTGISSHKTIETIEEWKKVCSVSSVFSFLSLFLQENKDGLWSEGCRKEIGKKCFSYLENNIRQWRSSLSPSLKDEGWKCLEDFWGKDFLEKAKSSLEKEKS